MSHAIPIKSRVSCKGKRTSDRNVSTVTVSAEGTMIGFCIDTFCPHTVTFDPSLRSTAKVKSCGSIRTLEQISFQLGAGVFSAAISVIAIGFEISMTTLSGRSLWAASSPMLSGISPPSCVMISALFPTTAYRTFPTQTKRMGFSGDDRLCKRWNFSAVGEN